MLANSEYRVKNTRQDSHLNNAPTPIQEICSRATAEINAITEQGSYKDSNGEAMKVNWLFQKDTKKTK